MGVFSKDRRLPTMVASAHSSRRRPLANTCPVPSTSTLNPMSSMRLGTVHTGVSSTPKPSLPARKMPPATVSAKINAVLSYLTQVAVCRCSRPLYHWKGTDRCRNGQGSPPGRQLFWSPGLFRLPLIRWWNWLWFRCSYP